MVRGSHIDNLFKGVPLNAYKFRVEALYQMFGTSKEMFNKAVYKIKVSADINSRQGYPNRYVTNFRDRSEDNFVEYCL